MKSAPSTQSGIRSEPSIKSGSSNTRSSNVPQTTVSTTRDTPSRRSSHRPNSSSNKRITQRELQRKIFLNTMRNVYPNSLQIHYEFNGIEEQFVLKPESVNGQCPVVPDKTWSDLISQLHCLFLTHVQCRQRTMLIMWSSLILSAILYLLIGVYANVLDEHVYQAFGPIFYFLAVLFLPNLVYTHLTIRPLLKHFEEWKHRLVLEFDKAGVEVVKVTTGEIVSDQSPYRWLGALYYGSTVWFRYEEAQVEVFWRSVKSGRHVRRYSLMIATAEGTGCDANENKLKKEAVLNEEEEDVTASGSTLASQDLFVNQN